MSAAAISLGSAEMPPSFSFNNQLDRTAARKGELEKTKDVLLPARVLVLRQSFFSSSELLYSIRNRSVGELFPVLLQRQL